MLSFFIFRAAHSFCPGWEVPVPRCKGNTSLGFLSRRPVAANVEQMLANSTGMVTNFLGSLCRLVGVAMEGL